MKHKKKVILIAGPTASGKSNLAIKLAKYFNGEIINADSMQIYKEISILTSKPSLQDIKIIKHHLYGFNPVKKIFSTGHWLKLVIKKIKKQWKNDQIPIIVGGTGLYFKALTDGLALIPEIPNNIKKKVRKLHKEIGQENFYFKLIKLDPLSKKFVFENDPQVKKFTYKSLFQFTKKTKLNFKSNVFKKFFLNIPKELLHKKIENRVEKMFKQGAVEEVERFNKLKINKDLSPNKIIGINEITDYLEGKTTLSKTKELIIQKTRQYAKRQYTWSRGHMRSWEMIYSPNINDLYKKIINKIS